jgi:uncharacterized protein DUF4124
MMRGIWTHRESDGRMTATSGVSMRVSVRTSLATVVATAMVAALPVQAQQQKTHGREAVYRCRDANGQTHFGDSMPMECQGLDTEVLDQNGMLMREIEGNRTRAARVAREASEKAARDKRDADAQHDRMLIDTYLTVADIERLRDQRLDLLEAQFKVTQQSIASLRDRQTRLQQQVARFKPYNKDPAAPPLPDHLGEEMVNTVNGINVYKQTLNDNKQEQTDIRASFDRDIKRFKELKGIH